MIIVYLCAGIIVGMLIGRFFRAPDPDGGCPDVVLGYTCKGEYCDHRKSTYYKAKATMAENQERKNKDINYWRGDDEN